ncbi:hypothetical protein PAL_GLEAN10025556 [Pteropus alecto]|uniref:Uncharacterized protein n=1 Tax=Pteropus alecto TaxID=9402 RepID=L5JNU9_PTEAL|nr:hypothetical protein PAL_GLEAN10025556 [Pteropus alecto]
MLVNCGYVCEKALFCGIAGPAGTGGVFCYRPKTTFPSILAVLELPFPKA